MRIEQIREVRYAEPFKPYTIHMSNEREFFVPHREFAQISPNSRIVVYFTQDGTVCPLDIVHSNELTTPKCDSI